VSSPYLVLVSLFVAYSKSSLFVMIYAGFASIIPCVPVTLCVSSGEVAYIDQDIFTSITSLARALDKEREPGRVSGGYTTSVPGSVVG
jgi:hypothetical protein